MEKVSPMMKQYMEIKEQNKDSILFFRLGDFYEMFFEDAILTSKELELTLTGKNCGLEERAPMCGVPYHAVEIYIKRLTDKGYKVAVCEQTEDPNLTKGIVKREVVRIVTPGTVIDVDNLENGSNHYLMCIYQQAEKNFGVAVVDTTVGEFKVTKLENKTLSDLMGEIAKYDPAEVVVNARFYENEEAKRAICDRFKAFINFLPDYFFDLDFCIKKLKQHFNVATLEGYGIAGEENVLIACGATLEYLYQNQKSSLGHISKVSYYNTSDYMILDLSTRRNLELVETLREKNKKGSLLWVLDKTKTAMGARLLKKWLEEPLIHQEEIIERLDGVEAFKEAPLLRMEVRELLSGVYDFERLVSKIVYGTIHARDLIALKSSIKMLAPIKLNLEDMGSVIIQKLNRDVDLLEDVWRLIEDAIIDDPPLSVREANMIKKGYNKEVDTLREAKNNGNTWLLEIEAREREKTGIKNLKVSYNKVFGYYIEITKSNLANVPDYFIRKQTIANGERFITDELKKIEDTILGAEDKLIKLEYELFEKVREEILKQIVRIQKVAGALAVIDVLQSFAEVADKQKFVKPEVTSEDVIEIKDGRHPVVEKWMSDGQFITNDTYLDNAENEIAIITGPNMAGKSTYMRQVAIITLLSQIGSFVPASSAKVGVVDRIFTRVGASDDLSQGQSTFMVEMIEVANILNHATSKSLLILDEIGRGTSTFDGLSIAWAVIEHLHKKIKAKTLFATHYHELTELEKKLENVKNYYISVKEVDDDILFLRKIVAGELKNSYGVQVAKLAGVPAEVTKRAKDILRELERADVVKKEETADQEVDLFSYVNQLNIEAITPIEAMNILYELKSKIK